MAKKRLLIVCYGAGHVNSCLPILRMLRLQADLEVVILGLTTAAKVLAQEGFDCLGFKDFVNPAVDSKALQWGRKLQSELENPPVEVEESIAYLGLSFFDLITQQGGEAAALQMYQQEGRYVFLPMTVLGRVIDQIQPDLVFATESPRAERAAILQARARNIPSLVLMGLPVWTHPDWMNASGFGDRICVFSEHKKQQLISFGRPYSEIIVTGSPLCDRLAKRDDSHKIDVYRKKRGWQGYKVVLWAMGVEPQEHPFSTKVSPYTDLNHSVYDECVKWVGGRSDVKVILRPHPNQTIDFGPLPENIEVDSCDVDSKMLLQSVNTVMTSASTMGFEAVYLNLPLVTLNMSVFTELRPYSKMGLSLPVDVLGEVGSRLDEALAGGWKPESRLPAVGQATRLVVDQINELIN